MRLSFKIKLIISFLLIFGIYTGGIIYVERQQASAYKAEAMQSKLNDYTDIIHSYINHNSLFADKKPNIVPIVKSLPEELRVTIIDNDGKVLFDKSVENYNSLENHLDRIEVKTALYQNFGTNIRRSMSTKDEYLYYAKHYSDYYVRVALPYNLQTKSLLKANNYFIVITLILFILVLLLLYLAASRFNKSILNLKVLTRIVKDNKPITNKIDFSNDELGDISKELVYILDQKEKSKKEIEAEREKLRLHFQYSELGLAFFNPDLTKIYANTHFIQFANLLVEAPIFNIEAIFEDKAFSSITEFLKHRDKEDNIFISQINKNGRIFSFRVNIFEDNSFELSIKDITKVEKTRILKQEMTSNIAHELRTPVTALRGFLETLDSDNLPIEKQKYFIGKAYLQSIRLSNLIEDVSLLSKIEEENSSFEFEDINISGLIDNVRINSSDKLLSNESQLITTIEDKIKVRGNYTLLLSAMQNLVDNSLKYGGKGVDIHMSCHTEDDKFYYFSFYDTGKGVEEKHLNKLFERFYRISEGRDRNTGGSGLGLSIVKNIFLLHQGGIQAKNHSKAGLEFLFKLKK